MVKRIFALAFIFVCTSIAWLILGGTIMSRTGSSTSHLRGSVQSIWGSPQSQTAPAAQFEIPIEYTEAVTENGVVKSVRKTRYEAHFVRPVASEVAVDLGVDHRRKGLLWYSTYKVGFLGDYAFINPDPVSRTMRLTLLFPAAQAIYDDLQFIVNGQPVTPVTEKQEAYWKIDVAPGQRVNLRISYRSQGLDSWRYSFGQEVNPVRDFHLKMTTNFKDIDFPDNTLSPGSKRETANGWQLDWNYRNLVSGYEIAMAMPEKLQPGPLASEISFFAPVSLFFFFFLIFIITTLRGIDIHPMNYFFLACAFFAFHLLLAYLADHVEFHLSFAIASAVSVFLVVTYLRLAVGTQFALREAALAQVIYLVLFSYAFFFKGLTGLAITIGAIITLFVVMQMTGRIRWSDRFRTVPPLPLGNNLL